MVLRSVRVVWRSVYLAAGALCVMMDGITEMLELYVGNWDTQLRVSMAIIYEVKVFANACNGYTITNTKC